MFKRIKFLFTFRVDPLYQTDAEKEQIQEVVDMVLRRLAEKFLSNCHMEESGTSKPYSAKEARKNIEWMRVRHARVNQAKKRFWSAHGLADHFDLSVHKRAKGYLESDHYLQAVKATDYKE